jgi:hypothetical protein
MIKEHIFSLVDMLRKHNLRYALFGAVAVNYWGEPRGTRDIDFMVAVEDGNIEGFTSEARKAGWSVYTPKETGSNKYVVNFPDTAMFAELWIPRPGSYDEELLNHRVLRKIFKDSKRKFWISSPETVLIHKLLHGGHKDLGDIVGIMNRQGHVLDRRYLQKWASRNRRVMSRYRMLAKESLYGDWLLEDIK